MSIHNSRSIDFYNNITKWLTPIYPTIIKEDIIKLNDIAKNYFYFLLKMDKIVDNESANSTQDYIESINILELAIKELTLLLQNEEYFWSAFSNLRKTQQKTILWEKDIAKTKSFGDKKKFEEVAIGKSSFVFALIYALETLSGVKTYHNDIIICIENIHIAFQYLDDVDDFKDDLQLGQWTYAHNCLADFFNEKNININQLDNKQKHKYFFLSGIASNFLENASYHFSQAKVISEKLNLLSLTTFLDYSIRKTFNQREEIEILIEKTKSKAEKSQQLVYWDKNKPLKQSLDIAIENGLDFLSKQIDENGLWKDFTTNVGFGSSWVTGYAASQIAEIAGGFEILKRVNTQFLTDSPAYNKTAIADGDSLNCILLYLMETRQNIPQELCQKWLGFQEGNSGWRTYNDAEALRHFLELDQGIDLNGWTSASTCVSALSAYVLSKIALSNQKELLDKTPYHKVFDYLNENQNQNGLWESYWWTSPLYATYFALSALQSVGKATTLENTIKGILNLKVKNHWIDPVSKLPNNCYTAFAAKILMLGESDFYSDLKSVIHWLLEQQTMDGSWLGGRILRVPAPNVRNPDTEVPKWRTSSFGVNIVTDDHNRIFTTSTVLNALNQYRFGL